MRLSPDPSGPRAYLFIQFSAPGRPVPSIRFPMSIRLRDPTRWRLCTLVVALSVSVSAGSAGAVDKIFGVGTHFAFSKDRGYLPEQVAPLIQQLGIQSFRDDIFESAMRD